MRAPYPVDIQKLLEQYSLAEFPAALGGCQNQGTAYESCEYDIAVFDERDEPDTIVEFEGRLAAIHHCSLSETRSSALAQFSEMKIVSDERWELRMCLARIAQKKSEIFGDYEKNCLIDSLFCITKSRKGLESSDPLAPCWLKCAAFYLADAILLHHNIRPSPAHFLQQIRGLKDSKTSAKFLTVNECIGIERSTPVLLERMTKSTVGFSDMVEGNDHSKIIRAKSNYLIENSLHADCYFYLGRINRDNIIKIKDSISKKPELSYVLKVALDIESDPALIQRQADMLYEATNEVLSALG